AGYRPGIDGYQLQAIAPHDGYDPKAVLSAPLLGKLVWGDFDYTGDITKVPILSDTENTSNLSHFSKILSTGVTKVINLPVMSISETNGIAGCIYNMTIPNIDNWRRFAQGSRLEEWRTRASLPAIGQQAAYVGFASQLGLGNSAPNRIELKNIAR